MLLWIIFLSLPTCTMKNFISFSLREVDEMFIVFSNLCNELFSANQLDTTLSALGFLRNLSKVSRCCDG